MKVLNIVSSVIALGVVSASAASPELVHRWSFSGDYTDSVGGSTATAIGSGLSFNEGSTAVVMSGAGNGKGSLNLGTGMLPTDVSDVTVEIWATQTAIKNWARIFDYGPDNMNYFMAAWNQGTTASRDKVELRKDNSSIMVSDTTLCPFTLNTPYHFSFTFRTKADGSTHISWARRNATSGAVEKAGDSFVPNWQLSKLVSPKFYLGHSQFSGDHDANAIYDEVRVWKGALTEEQLKASVVAGPDALPEFMAATSWTGAAGDGDVQNAENWSDGVPDANSAALFTGDVAVQIPVDSPLTCAGVYFNDARLTADCDWRGLSGMTAVQAGRLDLNGNKLYVSGLNGTGVITDTYVPGSGESAGGELHIDTASGVTSHNTGVEISGTLKVIKEGAGTYKATALHNNSGVGKFVQGTLNIVRNHFTISDLDGSGTITSDAGNVLKNGDMQADTVTAGAHAAKSPRWWNYSGTVYVIKNDRSYADSQANNSNWCFINNGSSLSQNFYLSEPSVCRVSMNYATKNDDRYVKSNGNMTIDSTTVLSWTDLGYRTSSYTGYVALSAGWHTIKISCTSGAGMSADNVSVVPLNVLEVNVPEGVTSINNNVTITGGANMQVWKSGAGTLWMKRANMGFGVGGRYSNAVSFRVKEGVAKQTTTGGTGSCGAQYSTIQVDDGAQFDLCGRVYHDYDYNIAGAGPDGSGALVSSVEVSNPWDIDSNKRGYLQILTLSGNATIGGPEAWAMLFYNRDAAGKVNLNGHTLTVKGVTLYGGNSSYNGSGKIVVAEDARLEFVIGSPTAGDCEVVVNGILAQNGKALTPVKSLIFTETGKFNNQTSHESTPQIVVRSVYAPNLAALEGSHAAPTVQLGANGYTDTTLDISRFSLTFDAATTTFYKDTSVTIDLGERTFTEDTRLVAWSAIPDVAQFIGAGAAIEEKQVAIAVRNDGIWAVVLNANMPMTAKWIGAGDVSSPRDPANWNCFNAAGGVVAGAVPCDYTTVIVDAGTTTLSIPEGGSAPWPRVVVGDGLHTATQWGRIYFGGERSAYSDTSFTETPLGDYTALGAGDVNHANEKDTAWTYSFLDISQVRFDGWFNVTAEQAGSWSIDQKFDDFFGFAVDGEWVVLNKTFSVNASGSFEISEGWHRFTLICGDTAGGQGASATGNVCMRIFINGAETPVSFSSSNFQMGSDQAVVKLGADCDWRAMNRVELSSAPVIDLNGHNLKIKKLFLDDYVGAKIINTAANVGTLTIEVDEGDTYTIDGLTIDGNVKVVKSGAGTLVMSTAAITYTGGTVVDAGTMKSGKNGTNLTMGTINLVKNGGFDDGTALSENSGNWSYGDKPNFAMPYWSSSSVGKIGLTKRNTTWVADVGVGKYALLMQTNSGNTSDVSQDIEVAVAGTYRYSFSYAARPKYTGAITHLRLIHNGETVTLTNVTSSATSFTTVEGEVELDEAGTYTLQFYQPSTSADRANLIDNVVFSPCEATAKEGAVQVNSGATFEVAGKRDFYLNSFVLNGGTVKNTGGDLNENTAQLKYVFLADDSVFSPQNDCGLIGNGYTKTVLDLGGHTLKVDIGVAKHFWLCNTEARNGTILLNSGGYLSVGKNGLAASEGVTLNALGAAFEINGAVDVQNYISRYSADYGTGTSAFKVYGTFEPATDYFFGCQMQNGSTIDLTSRTGSWHTTSSITKGATRVVTFADGATITLNIAGRSDLYDIARSEFPFIVTWDADPENLEALNFLPDSASKKNGFKIVPDSLTVTEGETSTTTYGLKIVYIGGTTIFIR